MRAVCSPCSDHLICPRDASKDCGIIAGSNRISGFAHLEWVRIAPSKDIGDLKCPKSQRPRTSFAAFNRGVILHLGRLGGVQHNKQHAFPACIPRPCQRITVAFAVRIGRRRRRIVFDMRPRNHVTRRKRDWAEFHRRDTCPPRWLSRRKRPKLLHRTRRHWRSLKLDFHCAVWQRFPQGSGPLANR